MVGDLASKDVPVPEKKLRDLPKDLPRVIPNFAEKEQSLGVKELEDLVGPILDTADAADVTPTHRAAACNAVCAIIENVQGSEVEYARNAVLDDRIWFRLFQVYLQRCDDAKGKSVRQVLLVLTGVLLKNQSLASLQIQDRAASTFIDIICLRHDRPKVKPALQGLAHFLLKSVISLQQLIDIYKKSLPEEDSNSRTDSELSQSLFRSILAWIVHHDTSLAAGNLIKNYLSQLRRSPFYETSYSDTSGLPLWIKPVVSTLLLWPDRIQEFKTHVFPHCFLPNIDECLQLLSYLHFGRHITTRGQLPGRIQVNREDLHNDLEEFEEFKVLLAAIQTGKEMGIIKDVDYRQRHAVGVERNAIILPDDTFANWLSHHEPEVRLAGLFSSIYSTNVTRPVTNGVFKSLKRHLIHLHTDTDANFRRELLGYTQKLFDRLRGSMSSLAKPSLQGKLSNRYGESMMLSQSRVPKQLRSRLGHGPLARALSFLIWYIQFLEWEIRSTSSYQRRITALRALTIALKSGLDSRVPHRYLSRSARGQIHWPHGLHLFNSRLMRALLDLMLDPFDDIRSAAASLLELCFDSYPTEEKATMLSILPPFISRAEATMLRTGRADHADGLARAYSLLFSQATEDLEIEGAEKSNGLDFATRSNIFGRLVDQLEETIKVAQNDMSIAVEGRPVHGIFAALRYIIDQEAFYTRIIDLPLTRFDEWRHFHGRICTSYKALWACIRDVLCADAPEGHVPEEMEDEASIDTKEILSYSWRGLKEASILLRTVISKAPLGNHVGSIVRSESFETLGRLCFTQLVDLRHRGAFSTVAQTFAVFCRRCLSTDDRVLLALPEKWYQETLLCIQDKANFITRRSAGIPALVSSIVAAEAQPGSGSLFPRAMKDLIAEASREAQDSNIEESRLPQVHALNCIKEIFTTSSLSAASEAYLGECLNLAAKSLNSKIWPIRNSSLVLFKALIHRLLGSDESQDWKERDRTKTSRFSYQNYSSLAGLLTDLLDPNGPLQESMSANIEGSSPLDLHGAEGVFPALQILRQAPPPTEARDIILKHVLVLLSSPHWHLRDMAARTVEALYFPQDDLETITSLLASVEGVYNRQHGLLLALKYLVRRLLRNIKNSGSGTTLDLNALILILTERSAAIFVESQCPFTKAAFLDLVNQCGMKILQQQHDELPEDWDHLTDSLGKMKELGDTIISDSALFRRSGTQWRAINQAITGYRPGPGLLRLARSDPDTCLALLETLSEIIEAKSAMDPAYTTALLAQIHLQTLNAEDEEVVSKAQAILADALLDQERRSYFFNNVQERDVMNSLEKLELQCLEGSPSNMQSALHLLGFLLDFAFSAYAHHRRAILQQIARYIRLLRRAIDEENPFDTRFAAVQSLCALSHIFTLPSSAKSTLTLLLGLSIILYDLLNDDDDEIRDAAATATSRLLQAQSSDPSTAIKPAVSILTTYRLAEFLTTHYRTSALLAGEALRRLTGFSTIAELFETPFAESLAEARKEDNALFSTEKRNLFKDDTLDTALWSCVLRSLSPTSVPLEHANGLKKWALEGLKEMTETAKQEGDGPLGWTSKPEVFTLGMRVICAAEVVLGWNVDVVEKAKVKIALRELADVAGGEGIHGLWLEKIDSVLESSVMESLGRVYGSLRSC